MLINWCGYFELFRKICEPCVVITKLYYRSGNNTQIVPRGGEFRRNCGPCVPSLEQYNPCMNTNICYSTWDHIARQTIWAESVYRIRWSFKYSIMSDIRGALRFLGLSRRFYLMNAIVLNKTDTLKENGFLLLFYWFTPLITYYYPINKPRFHLTRSRFIELVLFAAQTLITP